VGRAALFALPACSTSRCQLPPIAGSLSRCCLALHASPPPPSLPAPSRRIRRGSYSEQDARRLVREMVRAVAQCHGMNVMLRDIKPENVGWIAPRATEKGAGQGQPKQQSRGGGGNSSQLLRRGPAAAAPFRCVVGALCFAPTPPAVPAAPVVPAAQFMFRDRSPGSPLKAIDFGISVFCQPGQYVDVRAGTPIYIAPDVS
jgi:serine/threonine protein kinase